MKLKDINDGIATTCNVRQNVVSSVQAETFKQIRSALEKGEKIMIPGFGMFAMREVPGEDGAPAKKSIRFKMRDEKGKEGKEGKGRKNKEGRKAKKAAAAAAATGASPEASSGDGDGE
jgi:nucleoid DNA-binding protein